MLEQINSPSEEFIRFFVSKIYGGRSTQTIKDQFTPLITQAFSQLIAEHKWKNKSSLQSWIQMVSKQRLILLSKRNKHQLNPLKWNYNIGWRAWRLSYCQALLRDCGSKTNSNARCSKLLRHTSWRHRRKPICRLYFNTANKYASFSALDKEEKGFNRRVDDLYQYFGTTKKCGFEIWRRTDSAIFKLISRVCLGLTRNETARHTFPLWWIN